MSKILCLDVTKKNRMFIPYENIDYLALTFNKNGEVKTANVTLKDGIQFAGVDAWFTTVEAFIGSDEDTKEVKKIGF